MSKSIIVASCIPICTMLMTKSAPSTAARRSACSSTTALALNCRAGPARHHAGGLEPLLVDVVQRDLDLAQLGEIEDVGQEVLEEDGAAGADHRDLDHLVEVLGSAT
jgi:hypothetical protein